jgi:hypothetical protein
MPSHDEASGQPTPDPDAPQPAPQAQTAALSDAMLDLADLKRYEWRPRHTATTARRLARFEAAIQRNSIKPTG